MDQLIALYDSDIFYATRFMEYYKKKKPYRFEFAIFTKKESLEDYLRHHSIEILIAGEKEVLPDTPAERVKFSYQLCEQHQTGADTDQKTVFKYQSAGTLLEEIMTDYYRKTTKNSATDQSNQVKILAVHSLIPSAEAIAFAWSLGLLLSEQKRVLLLNLDPLPIPFPSSIHHNNSSISEFIYHLKENSNVILKMKEQVICCGNLSYLNQTLHGEDIFSLDEKDIQKWAGELRQFYEYSTVIFYLSGFTPASMEVLRQSDRVFLPYTGTVYQNLVHQVWAKQMELSKLHLTGDKFLRILLQEEKELGQSIGSLSDLLQTKAFQQARNQLTLAVWRLV